MCEIFLLQGPPLLPCKTQEVDSGEGRFPSGVPKNTGKESRIQGFSAAQSGKFLELPVERQGEGCVLVVQVNRPHQVLSTKYVLFFQDVLFSVLLYS